MARQALGAGGSCRGGRCLRHRLRCGARDGACAAELATRLRRYAQTAAASQKRSCLCVLRHTNTKPRHCAPRRPGNRPAPRRLPRPAGRRRADQSAATSCRHLSRGAVFPWLSRDVSRQRPVCHWVLARLSGDEQRSGAGPHVCAEGHTQASSSDLRKLSEQRERSERSEFFRRAGSASSAGQSAKPTAAVAHPHRGTQPLAPPPTPKKSVSPSDAAKSPWAYRCAHRYREAACRSCAVPALRPRPSRARRWTCAASRRRLFRPVLG